MAEQETPADAGGEVPELIPGTGTGVEIVVDVPLKSRLTVVEMVYHQPAGDSPTTAFGDAVRFSRQLDSDEQPYERRRVATEQWHPLDCGWIEHCGMLLIRNDEGKFFLNPTPEEKAAVAGRILEVGSEEVSWLVLPGETMRACPSDAGKVRVRCRCGNAKYTIYMIPG